MTSVSSPWPWSSIEERGLPLYYRCYEGNVTDVVALSASLSGMIRQGLLSQAPARLTIVLDKGNVSFDNFKALQKAQFFLPGRGPGRLGTLAVPGGPASVSAPGPGTGKAVKVYAQADTRLGGSTANSW